MNFEKIVGPDGNKLGPDGKPIAQDKKIIDKAGNTYDTSSGGILVKKIRL
ncbi:MAG: hypothetical protein V4665_00400 [Patescibacteria group bacterium]